MKIRVAAAASRFKVVFSFKTFLVVVVALLQRLMTSLPDFFIFLVILFNANPFKTSSR